MTFIALCGATAPHFTTIAHFISTLGTDIVPVFAAVLAVCDKQGLIGREMFAIDGVKLPSNASKRRSGTRAELAQRATKLEAAAATMLARHRTADMSPVEPDLRAKETTRIARLADDAKQIRDGGERDTVTLQWPMGTARCRHRVQQRGDLRIR